MKPSCRVIILIIFLSYFRSVEVKRQLPRRDSSKEGLRELSKLLALDGAVVGKGEIIERNHIRKPLKLDSITQADSFCIDFEIKQKSLDDEDEEAAKKRIDFAYSKNMVAQVIEKCQLICANRKCRARIRTDHGFLETPQPLYQHLYHLHQLPQLFHYFISITVLTTSWEFDMEENLLVSVGVEWGAKQRFKSVQTQRQGLPNFI